MKPIYVILIAIAAALTGGLIGAAVGGTAGGVLGSAGGGQLGMQMGVCSATETAKAQKLLSPAQADQLLNQTVTQLGKQAGLSKPNCQEVMNELNKTNSK